MQRGCSRCCLSREGYIEHAYDETQRGGYKMTNPTLSLIIAIVLAGASMSPAFGAQQKVTLMLGGKFCDAYLGDVSDPLNKVDGSKTWISKA
jgi:hypothetical protein